MNAITGIDYNNLATEWKNTPVLFLTIVKNLLEEQIEPGTVGKILSKSKTKQIIDAEWNGDFFDVEVNGSVLFGVHCSKLSLEVSLPYVVFYRLNQKDMPVLISVKSIIKDFVGSVNEKAMIKRELSFERQILSAMLCYGSYGVLSDVVWDSLFVEYKKQSTDAVIINNNNYN